MENPNQNFDQSLDIAVDNILRMARNSLIGVTALSYCVDRITDPAAVDMTRTVSSGITIAGIGYFTTKYINARERNRQQLSDSTIDPGQQG